MREPMTGFWGRSPQWGSRGGAPGEGQGLPPEADDVFLFKTLIFNGFAAVLHEMMYNLYF